MNLIMRPVFNRPEMLFLSLEYESKAREYYDFSSELTTLFIVESGADLKTLELVDTYPYPKIIVKRAEKFGLSKNILTGFLKAFDMTDNFVIYIEDDVLIHKTYFQYMDILLRMFNDNECTILSPFNGDDDRSVNELYKGHYYTALAPLIYKNFFNKYIKPCITEVYYKNFMTRDKFVRALAKKYGYSSLYKYRDNPGAHNEQAGLINKLVDVALIEEGKHVIMPYVNRQQHIGYFGKNRPGGKLPGKTFEQRLSNLREIILSADKMYELSATKQYNDYLAFSPKLEEWDGTLTLKETSNG
jgi:hypothetical protein